MTIQEFERYMARQGFLVATCAEKTRTIVGTIRLADNVSLNLRDVILFHDDRLMRVPKTGMALRVKDCVLKAPFHKKPEYKGVKIVYDNISDRACLSYLAGLLKKELETEDQVKWLKYFQDRLLKIEEAEERFKGPVIGTVRGRAQAVHNIAADVAAEPKEPEAAWHVEANDAINERIHNMVWEHAVINDNGNNFA